MKSHLIQKKMPFFIQTHFRNKTNDVKVKSNVNEWRKIKGEKKTIIFIFSVKRDHFHLSFFFALLSTSDIKINKLKIHSFHLPLPSHAHHHRRLQEENQEKQVTWLFSTFTFASLQTSSEQEERRISEMSTMIIIWEYFIVVISTKFLISQFVFISPQVWDFQWDFKVLSVLCVVYACWVCLAWGHSFTYLHFTSLSNSSSSIVCDSLRLTYKCHMHNSIET